jgi:hypothetical protein
VIFAANIRDVHVRRRQLQAHPSIVSAMICDTARAPTETIAAELTVPARVLLFCLASDTNWVKAGVTHATAQHLLVRNLVERNHATDFVLTDQGRSVLDALIA